MNGDQTNDHRHKERNKLKNKKTKDSFGGVDLGDEDDVGEKAEEGRDPGVCNSGC